MAVKQGTVGNCEVKGPFRGNKGPFFRHGITVDGEEFSALSNSQQPMASSGDIVEFTYEVNVKAGVEYKNINAQSFRVTGRGAPTTNPARSGGSNTPPSSTGFDNRSLEIKAGRAVNNAVILFQMGHTETLDTALREAVALEVKSDKYYSRIYKEEMEKLEMAIAAKRAAAAPPPVAEDPLY